MFIASLLVVVSLAVTPVQGVPLQAHLSEPNDIQPALGVNVYQDTVPASVVQPAAVFGEFQPTVRAGVLQNTYDPQPQTLEIQ